MNISSIFHWWIPILLIKSDIKSTVTIFNDSNDMFREYLQIDLIQLFLKISMIMLPFIYKIKIVLTQRIYK